MDTPPLCNLIYSYLEYEKTCSLLLSELAVRTEHIHNLVDVHLLHVLARRLEILTLEDDAK